MKSVNKLLIFLIASTFIYGCSGENSTNKEANNTIVSEDGNDSNQAMDEDEPEFFLPSSLQIGSVFQRSGLGYVEGIVLNPGKVSEFTTKTEKLLALGVYSANLSYAVLNNQNQQAINTLKSVKMLSDEVGLSEVFSANDLLSSFERNLGNQDSIMDILITIQERTDNFVDENKMKAVSTAIFAGAWTEGMYMGVKATSGEDREKITNRLLEQMVILSNLIQALEYYHASDAKIMEVNDKFKSILEYYENIEVIKNREEESLRDLKINYSDIKQIADIILETRQLIVKA